MSKKEEIITEAQKELLAIVLDLTDNGKKDCKMEDVIIEYLKQEANIKSGMKA